MSENNLKLLALFSLLSLTIAGLLLLTTLYDRVQPAPAKILSVDYRHLELRAIANFIIVGFSATLVYRTLLQELSLPSKFIFVTICFAFILFGLVGGLVFRYFSLVGWCCEKPFAAFFGFPFSWLRIYGLDPYNYELTLGQFIDIFRTNFNQVTWQIGPLGFVIDIIFWF